MPDITMCISKKCKFKKNCYRYMARPSFMQSFAALDDISEDCPYYLPIKKEHKKSVKARSK